MFELLNEPNDWLNASVWNDDLSQALERRQAEQSQAGCIIDSPESSFLSMDHDARRPNDPSYPLSPFIIMSLSNSLTRVQTGLDMGHPELDRHDLAWYKCRENRNYDELRLCSGLGEPKARSHPSGRVWCILYRRDSITHPLDRIRSARSRKVHGFAWAYWEFGAGLWEFTIRLQMSGARICSRR